MCVTIFVNFQNIFQSSTLTFGSLSTATSTSWRTWSIHKIGKRGTRQWKKCSQLHPREPRGRISIKTTHNIPMNSRKFKERGEQNCELHSPHRILIHFVQRAKKCPVKFLIVISGDGIVTEDGILHIHFKSQMEGFSSKWGFISFQQSAATLKALPFLVRLLVTWETWNRPHGRGR